MKQALPSGTKGYLEKDVQLGGVYRPVLVAVAILLVAAFVILGTVLYRADAVMIVPTTSPIPLVVLDPAIYLPEIISFAPLPTDGYPPVPQPGRGLERGMI